MTTTYPYNVGPWKWESIHSSSGEAKEWLNRGVSWMYGYNHAEAVICFEECIKADETCAMAYWLTAYSMGPNYNMPWDFVSPEVLKSAREILAKGERQLVNSKNAWEKEMFAALSKRYPSDEKGDDVAQWGIDFCKAMGDIVENHKDEVDLWALAAESIMAVTPWKLWDIQKGEPMPEPAQGLKALEFLQNGQDLIESRNLPPHVGICHFFIHCYEMSPFPERALKYGDIVSEVCPALGHLVHMGTHIHILCGMYYDAMYWNRVAVGQDMAYLNATFRTKFYALYAVHNFHFMMYGAQFSGIYDQAMKAANGLWELLSDDFLSCTDLPLAAFGEAYKSTKYHTMVRFGGWEDILAEEFPKNQELNCVTTASLHYARALAFGIGRGDIESAEKEQAAFEDAFKKVPPGMGRLLHNNTGVDLLSVNREMMKGELLFVKGKHEEAVAALKEAIKLEDALPYDEPWGIMQPTRHALGAILLEMNRPEEALELYQQDLGLAPGLNRTVVHIKNIWSMLGVVDCHKVLKKPVDPHFQMELDIAMARADKTIKASCFCRVSLCCKSNRFNQKVAVEKC
eukprot:TRINITY_DN626_c0_g1_i11.p1 TRINITY_DN626_c0_g1~~TRINITY_DN626_c0_g1_i11.p1  ORF type:complete len:571 (+),score=133.57 TRINITY_DN626_c0_g1_i11:49-1761(+)